MSYMADRLLYSKKNFSTGYCWTVDDVNDVFCIPLVYTIHRAFQIFTWQHILHFYDLFPASTFLVSSLQSLQLVNTSITLLLLSSKRCATLMVASKHVGFQTIESPQLLWFIFCPCLRPQFCKQCFPYRSHYQIFLKFCSFPSRLVNHQSSPLPSNIARSWCRSISTQPTPLRCHVPFSVVLVLAGNITATSSPSSQHISLRNAFYWYLQHDHWTNYRECFCLLGNFVGKKAAQICKVCFSKCTRGY